MAVRVTGLTEVIEGIGRVKREMTQTERDLLAFGERVEQLTRASAESAQTPEGAAWSPRKATTVRTPTAGGPRSRLATRSERRGVIAALASRGLSTVGVRVRRDVDGTMRVTRASAATSRGSSSVGVSKPRTPEEGSLGFKTGKMIRSITITVRKNVARLTVGTGGARYAKYFIGYSSRQPARPILPTHETGSSAGWLDDWLQRLADGWMRALDG